MKEYIIEVPDRFGQELKPEKVNSEIKGELVRCKECKHQIDRGRKYKECDKHFLWANDDWFCADGERKE